MSAIPHTIDAPQPMPKAIEQMAENCERAFPWFEPCEPHTGSAVIVAGGPSMATRLEAIKLRQDNGGTVLALNGARKFLTDNGIKPDMVLLCDPSQAVAGFVEEPDEAIYLIASIVHPDVLDRLAAFPSVYLWHPEIPSEAHRQMAILYKNSEGRPQGACTLVGGGNTGALRTLPLLYLLGYRSFNFYGLDSSYPRGEMHHAYVKHHGGEPEPMTALVNGKSYCCSPWMIRQADEFKFYYQQYTRGLGCSVMVHGEGLIPDLWRAMRQLERKGHKPMAIQKPFTVH